ncbi:SRPBCC family protein [Halogeometricum sp. S1BR25-6]|uniref:SRPBCC family protein n=1 Tax=Halogeometricum salsisoli TaxID=2950536 RepID=A0ABU2GCH2_9EURY|nr:SRPBCC family protein [Halogeometricum sp. S1BR25-6]MDS0298511.1 SRPBCC family protein [Halogeometricum sp. S1BR25-6]
MTVRVSRAFEFDAPPEAVWEFIADPGRRAEAISVVESYDVDPETNEATWEVSLPIPLVRSTATVETEDVERDPPRFVRFVGTSKVMRVTGEHTIEKTETGSRLRNEFVVDGKLPGVESFFKRNLDRELDNLEAALRADLESTA